MKTIFTLQNTLMVSILGLALALSGCSRSAPPPEDPTSAAGADVPTDAAAEPGQPQLIPTTAVSQLVAQPTGLQPLGKTPTPAADSPTPSPAGGGGGGNVATTTPGGGSTPTASPGAPKPTANQPSSGTKSAPLPPGGGGSIVPPQSPVATPDYGGMQAELSPNEKSAQAVGKATYSGQRCGFLPTLRSCHCPKDTTESEFIFPDVNQLTWLTTDASRAVLTINMARRGVNTWNGRVVGKDQTVDIELIFLAGGYQQTISMTFPDGEVLYCPMVWTR